MKRLYFHYVSLNVRSMMQYKTSFFLTVLGQFLVSFQIFLGIFVMFQRFSNVEGFTYSQVLLCFSIMLLEFSLAEMFARGFDSFSSLVRSGEFDRILVKNPHAQQLHERDSRHGRRARRNARHLPQNAAHEPFSVDVFSADSSPPGFFPFDLAARFFRSILPPGFFVRFFSARFSPFAPTAPFDSPSPVRSAFSRTRRTHRRRRSLTRRGRITQPEQRQRRGACSPSSMSFQNEREPPSFWSSEPPMLERKRKSLSELACRTRCTMTLSPSSTVK